MRYSYNFTRTIFLYPSVTFFFVQYVFVRCLSMRHTCYWLVKHLNKHMQLAMHAALLHVLIKFHQSFWKECLARNNPLLNESKSIWKKEREQASNWHSQISYSSHRLYWQKRKNFIFKNSTHLKTLFMANYNNFHLF